jgi:membrane protease YdiL (CAAX protease family)
VLFVVLTLMLSAIWVTIAPDGAIWEWLSTIALALAAIVAGTYVLQRLDDRPGAALGLAWSPSLPRHLLLGLLIGGAGLASAAATLFATGALRYTEQPGTLDAWLGAVALQGAVFMVAALAEEAVFRGYLLQVLVRGSGRVFAIAMTSVLFAAVHGSNPEVGPLALVNIALAGVLLAVAYLRTLSLWFATALHMGWNWAMASLGDLPVSGIEEFDTPYYQPMITGPEWWTGGAFGPEGGLVGTIGFGVALVLTLRWKAVRQDADIAAARPLVLDEPAAMEPEFGVA